jgi:pyruvate/2-oxoglutarate dehydrogenase complex dihydrolipoamide dehydrogenase (E3) component
MSDPQRLGSYGAFVLVSKVFCEDTIRPIIDGRMPGFRQLIVDRTSQTILGFHIAGDRAVGIVAMAAIAIASKLRVNEVAQIPLLSPPNTDVPLRAVSLAASELRPRQTKRRDFVRFAA